MERKEVAVYLYLGVLIVASLLAVYFFNLQLTGFVVSNQQSDDFSGGAYNNTLVDGNNVVLNLSSGQSSGTYTSKVFDSNSSSTTWDNITWVEDVPENTTLSLQAWVCSSEDCSNKTLVSDLDNINVVGQYFQYEAFFSTSDFNVTPSLGSVVVSSFEEEQPQQNATLSIYSPSGTQTSRNSIPLKFVATGSNLTCSYNVKTLSGEGVVANTSLAACGNSTFNVNSDGDYVLTLYLNSSSEFIQKNSTFLVSTPPAQQDEEEEIIEPIIPEEFPPEVVETQSTADLSLQAIETLTLNPSSSYNLNLIATNTGDVSLNACKLSAAGVFASWISFPDSSQNMNAGEGKNFAFTLNVPEETAEGSYTFSLLVQCTEVLEASDFSANVVKKRVEFNITDVERTRSDRVVVSYSLEELLDEEQNVELQFFLYDAANVQAGNASANQTLSAGETDDFRTNIAINESLYNENSTLTLEANVNLQQYTVSVREPIVLGSPTGFFVLGDDLGTTGNVLAIVILIVGVVAVFFFLKRKNLSKKVVSQ